MLGEYDNWAIKAERLLVETGDNISAYGEEREGRQLRSSLDRGGE